jgi:hyperosmotically inducible periplasmic protein
MLFEGALQRTSKGTAAMSWWLGYGLTRAVGNLIKGEAGPQGSRDDGYILPDERARQAAVAQLSADAELDARKVEVRVLSGALTLLGSVPSEPMKARAEQICLALSGVSTVENELKVQ